MTIQWVSSHHHQSNSGDKVLQNHKALPFWHLMPTLLACRKTGGHPNY